MENNIIQTIMFVEETKLPQITN